MNKFFKRGICFLIFTIVVYVVLLILWGELMPKVLKKNLNYPLAGGGHMFSRIREIPKYKNVDVLVVGSSHAYRGFDPRIFAKKGYTLFNLGSSAQTPLQTQLLLEKYLMVIKPKLLIYEVSPEIFENDGTESSLDLIANDRCIDWRTVAMVFQLNHIKSYNALLYGYYRQLLDKNDCIQELPVKGEDTYILGGFVEKRMSYFHQNVHYSSMQWAINDLQKKAFSTSMTFIKEHKVKVLLVQAPITQSLYKSHVNNEEIDKYFSQIAPYINFNGIVPVSDSLHFYDRDHLNQEGVRIFDQKVIQAIQDSSMLRNN